MTREQAEELLRETIPGPHREEVLEFVARSIRFADEHADEPDHVIALPLESGRRFRVMAGRVSALSTWKGGLYVEMDRATLGEPALERLSEDRLTEEHGPSSTPPSVGVRLEFSEVAQLERAVRPAHEAFMQHSLALGRSQHWNKQEPVLLAVLRGGGKAARRSTAVDDAPEPKGTERTTTTPGTPPEAPPKGSGGLELDLLRLLTSNPAATFREGQLEAIQALETQDGNRVLCVQRTGWGKSAVYFIATALLRKSGSGPTVLISPLIALMRNQVAAAGALGIAADTVNSANREEWEPIFERLTRGEIDLLLVSPERLANPKFRSDVLPDLMSRCGLLVVDEAHCISDWGHDFRPDYRRIAQIVEALPQTTSVLCTTATANDRVVADVTEQLGRHRELITIRGPLDRLSLRLEVVDLPTQAERLAWLATHLPTLPGSGIIYCLTVRDTQVVADWLIEQEITAEAYFGPLDSDQRIEVEQKLLDNEVKAVVATSALGMGYDKPDLGFVVHFQAPGSPIAYYQQVGRAGRGLPVAHAVLLRGAEDRDVQDYFIRMAFPPLDQVKAVVDRLEAAGRPLSGNALLSEVNIGRARLEMMLKSLEVEKAVRKTDGGWVRTEAEWHYDEERVAAVTAAKRAEQAAMAEYGSNGQCLMELLRSQLDDPRAEPCGRCAICTAPRFDLELDRTLVLRAIAHLRGQRIEIAPRLRQPTPSGGYKSVPEDERLELGRALSVYADAGWGWLVKRGKFEDDRFSDELVEACIALLEDWNPVPAPTWVTAVPSIRRPQLVSNFAEQLAAALGLPFRTAIRKIRDTREQKQMENTYQQFANVSEAFSVVESEVLAQPALLVDDMVDSRWTLTEAGRVLRRAGVPVVHPLALAVSTPRR